MNLIQKIMIAGCGVAALASCKKDKPAPDNYISYKVDGNYKKLKPDADYFDDGSGFLIDAGPFNKGEMSISFNDVPVEKTYHFEDSTDVIAEYVDESGRNFWSLSGTLVINSYDGDHISGTFAFRGVTDTDPEAAVNVTEGQFSADVSDLSSSSDTTATDTTYGVSKSKKLMKVHLNHARIVSGKTVN